MARDDDWDGVKAHNDTLAAVRAEREACAQAAEEVARQILLPENERANFLAQSDVAEHIAKAIRARALTAGERG